MSTTHHATTPATTDPVVLYDVMREAATRVGACYVELRDHASTDAEKARWWQARVDVRDRVAAVDVDDAHAIQEETDQLRAEEARLNRQLG